MGLCSAIKNKIEDIKSNSIWFDKRVSFRFKLANAILDDYLRLLLACAKANMKTAYEQNHRFTEEPIKQPGDFFIQKAIFDIDEIFKL